MPSQTRSSSRSANSTLAVITESVDAAEAANLRYVTDEDSGIRRERRGKGFSYIGPDGERITDEEEIERIEKIAIPPAWNDVWICPDPNGHLLATGRDAKGRKQYRYHPRWRSVRDETKYNRMLIFSEALPAIRRRVARDLAKPGMPREKVLALVVRLLEMTLIRVGNDEYARQNRSFGLTTLRDKHVDVSGKKIEFSFKGKSGKRHTVDLEDKRLARVIRQCQELPGYELFQYVDEEGNTQDVDSGDVNSYIREITDEDFTAKDFRTWGGTVLAARALQELGRCSSETDAKKNITAATKVVAEQLGNTPAMCRRYYVHPAVLESYQSGELIDVLDKYLKKRRDGDSSSLDPEEAAVVDLLQRAQLPSTT